MSEKKRALEPVASVEVVKAKRGRKPKKVNLSEEIVKPIVNGIIKDATKVIFGVLITRTKVTLTSMG